MSEVKVSISRIQAFLEAPELSSTQEPIIDSEQEFKAIIVSQATCHWNSNTTIGLQHCNNDVIALGNINLEFEMGTLTSIIGGVGSGKVGHLPLLLSC